MAGVLCEQKYITGDGKSSFYKRTLDQRVYRWLLRQKRRNGHRISRVIQWPLYLPFVSPPQRVQASTSCCTQLHKKSSKSLTQKSMPELSTPTCEEIVVLAENQKNAELVADAERNFIKREQRRWFRYGIRNSAARHAHNQIYHLIFDESPRACEVSFLLDKLSVA